MGITAHHAARRADTTHATDIAAIDATVAAAVPDAVAGNASEDDSFGHNGGQWWWR